MQETGSSTLTNFLKNNPWLGALYVKTRRGRPVDKIPSTEWLHKFVSTLINKGQFL